MEYQISTSMCSYHTHNYDTDTNEKSTLPQSEKTEYLECADNSMEENQQQLHACNESIKLLSQNTNIPSDQIEDIFKKICECQLNATLATTPDIVRKNIMVFGGSSLGNTSDDSAEIFSWKTGIWSYVKVHNISNIYAVSEKNGSIFVIGDSIREPGQAQIVILGKPFLGKMCDRSECNSRTVVKHICNAPSCIIIGNHMSVVCTCSAFARPLVACLSKTDFPYGGCIDGYGIIQYLPCSSMTSYSMVTTGDNIVVVGGEDSNGKILCGIYIGDLVGRGKFTKIGNLESGINLLLSQKSPVRIRHTE